MREDHYREYGDPLIFELQSGVSPSFPSGASFPRADFQFTAGTGIADGEDPIQTEPSCSISWSNDGGMTFGSPVLRKLGAQGRYRNTVSVNRTGRAGLHGRRWKVQVADPVHVGFGGGAINANPSAG